jgi:iron complex outermembrane receptor protein
VVHLDHERERDFGGCMRVLRAILVTSGALFCAQIGSAEAQGVPFSQQAQPLSDALRNVAEKTGQDILFAPDAVVGQRAPAISGIFTAKQAVDLLLQNTDLEAVEDVPAGLIVRPRTRTKTPNLEEVPAQAVQDVESIVVTGSRLIFHSAESPTPVMSLPVQELRSTTPSNLPDALNKLPVFGGSTTPRDTNNASVNSAGNVLNLRNFGSQRTLILMDGHRVAASNANGTVDVDALPQMLIERVEIATGGASAVYGSDAVTGVVNFILDKHFDGMKIDTNAGISAYGDAASYNIGIAAGTDLFGARGHIEGSVRRFYQDGLRNDDRPEGPYDWILTGAGIATNPYVSTAYGRLTRYGGLITCAGCAVDGRRFNASGGVSPYAPGTPTGTNGVSVGGDGGYSSLAQITSSLGTSEAFGRFSYDLNDKTSFYVQASGAESYTKGSFQNHAFQTGAVPNTFLKTNPYMPASLAPLFAGSTPVFSVSGYFDMGYPRSGYQSDGLQRNLQMTTGLDGSLWGDRSSWDLYYTHGEGRLHEDDPTNVNYQRMYAAIDAVAGTTPGSVTCYVSTTANASLYRGCVPINPFGANSVGMNMVTPQMNNYISGDTGFWLTNIMDDVGGGISGNILHLPAGPVRAALSGEARWLGLGIKSNASPTATVDCTDLRISVPGAPANSLCNPVTPLWQNNTVAALPEVTESVREFAAEANVPIFKNLPLVRSLDADLAGRSTDYSTSGTVLTWKIGLNWNFNDEVRLRATNSVDIRAPTLNDLFAPINKGIQTFNDGLHTGVTAQNYSISLGNAALVPEVARTYTAGVLFTPTFFSNFATSVNYYTITVKNAISTISGNNASIQSLCETSGGTSPYCALIIRPSPFNDRSPTNFPTRILSQPINTAFNKLEGFDIEVNYHVVMEDIDKSLPGNLSLRVLTSVQPVNQSIQYPGAPLTFHAFPKTRSSAFATYQVGKWSFDILDRWISGFKQATQIGQIYANPRLPSTNYIDLNIDRQVEIESNAIDAYLSVENLLDQRPRVNPSTTNANPGLYFMGVQGPTASLYDAIGRYYTLGIRAKF